MATTDPTLEPKDSRSTLVEETERLRLNDGTPQPLSPGSPGPFSASFNPNGPTPATPAVTNPFDGPLARRPPMRQGSQVWRATLGTLADQFAAASQALAAAEAEAEADTDSATSTGGGSEGIAAVQQAQARLAQELEALREQVADLGDMRRRAEKQREVFGMDDMQREATETRFLGIEKKVDELADTIRLE